MDEKSIEELREAMLDMKTEACKNADYSGAAAIINCVALLPPPPEPEPEVPETEPEMWLLRGGTLDGPHSTRVVCRCGGWYWTNDDGGPRKARCPHCHVSVGTGTLPSYQERDRTDDGERMCEWDTVAPILIRSLELQRRLGATDKLLGRARSYCQKKPSNRGDKLIHAIDNHFGANAT